MPLNLDVIGVPSEPVVTSWTSKDCLLYALGVGAGVADPVHGELEFTTENSHGVTQRCLPTFGVVAAGAPSWRRLGDINVALLVHGEQSIEIHRSLAVEGSISSTSTVTAVYDKGSGAVVITETKADDAATGEPVFTLTASLFLRGEGGWGGERGPSVRSEVPTGDPDHVVSYPTRTDQALLYRLSGDRNPLHSDPAFAALAGFDRPILHGLCTYGFTGRALLHTLCDSEPDRFVSMFGRFSKPVFPGDELTVSIWELGDGRAAFRTATQDGTVVIDAGTCAYTS
jgi:acyl dehydratase